MSTNSSGGPSPFSEEEVEAATAPPAGDPEIEELDPADIDATEQEAPFEKIVAKSRKLTEEQIRVVLESVLFVAPQALSIDQLFDATGIDREKILVALMELLKLRSVGAGGVVLHEAAGARELGTAPVSAEYGGRFLKVKPQRLTRAAVETLALIAYRQPVTRPEIEDVRGVDSGAVLKALLDRRLIKIVGKREEVGRPILYGTTREFLEFFALKDLSALPTLREFQELTEESREIVEKEAPIKGVEGIVEELGDKGFEEKLAQQDAASEAALAQLESAIESADETSKTASKILNPPQPETSPDAAVAPAETPTNVEPAPPNAAPADEEPKPGSET